MAGLNSARYALGLENTIFPRETVIGSLAAYISDEGVVNFQPMNANFGLVAPLDRKVKGGKKARGEAMGMRAVEYMKNFTGKDNEFTEINRKNREGTEVCIRN